MSTRFAAFKNRREVIAYTRHFVRHLIEMYLMMVVGMLVLGTTYRILVGAIGYTNPNSQIPEWTALVMAFNMTAPMAVWMRIRGMQWRPIAEMSAAMFLVAFLLTGMCWLGMVHKNELVRLEHLLMLPAMLLPMLFRLDLYTGKAGHHVHAHAGESAPGACSDHEGRSRSTP